MSQSMQKFRFTRFMTLCVLPLLLLQSATVQSGDGGIFDLSEEISLELQPKFPDESEPFSIVISYDACRFLLSNPVFELGETEIHRTLTLMATDLGEGSCQPQMQVFNIYLPEGLERSVLTDVFVDFPGQGLVVQASVIFDIASLFLIGSELTVEFNPSPLRTDYPFQITVFHGHPGRTFDLTNPTLHIDGRRLVLRVDGNFLTGGGTGPIPIGPFNIPGLASGSYALDIEVDYGDDAGIVPVKSVLFPIGRPAPIPTLHPIAIMGLILMVMVLATLSLTKSFSREP